MKYKFGFFLVLLTFVLFICCAKNKEKNSQLSKDMLINVNKKEQMKVVILGYSDNPEDLNNINIISYASLFSKNYNRLSEIKGSEFKLEIDSISAPILMDFLVSIGESLSRSKIYISSSDTIKFTIENKELIFKGKNNLINNFYTQLYKNTADYLHNGYNGNIQVYKERVEEIYKSKVSFLENYITANKMKSTDFENIVKSDLKFQYLQELISPRVKQSGVSGIFYGNSDELQNIVQKEFSTKEIMFNYESYFDNIKVQDFNRPELLNNVFFKNSINKYIRHYFDSTDLPDYSREKLLYEKEFIESNFKGKLKDFAISKMIYDYMENGFNYNEDNNKIMQNLVNRYLVDTINKSSFDQMVIKELMDDLNHANHELSKNALDTELIDEFGETTTLREIFNLSNNRIKVIDFWASWCSPCIDEMKKAKYFKDRITIEKNVEWIYLSIDDDVQSWKDKSKELGLYITTKHNYWIRNGSQSNLSKYLKVQSIPRFIILDKKNQIRLNHATRPSDSLNFKRVLKEINR